MNTRSMRSDSSASSLQSPSSPIPSSIDAKVGHSSSLASKMDAKNKAKIKANGYPSEATTSTMRAENGEKKPHRESFGSRARSASMQKGVAVLRALSRAPENSTEEDSGYEDEAGEVVGPTPGKVENKNDGSEVSEIGLTEEAKESGRINREGLRRRGEDKEVDKLIGSRTQSNTSIDKSTGKRKDKKRQVWITEKPRKIFHGGMAFMVLYLYLWHIDLSKIIRSMTTFLIIVVIADIIRLNVPAFEVIYEKVLGFLMRESEKTKVNGVVWYLIGVITCLSLFPGDIACVSVMILSWADTAASIFGRLFGAHTPSLPSPPFASRKSTAGFAAAVIAASLTAALFWATPIAGIGKRNEGLSIYDDFGRGVFGTDHAPGLLGSGWTGIQWGFRPSHPNVFASKGAIGATRSFAESIRLASRAVFEGAKKDRPIPMPLLCIGSGIVAGIAEGLELGGVDDNLSLPILSALGIQLLLISWGLASSLLS